MGTIFGYARVSTKEQNTAAQEEALHRAGCSRIYRDIASGAASDRSGLEQCLADLTEGDTLVVWKLDRLGRSLPHLVQVVTLLKEKGIGFKSLTEGVVDTTNPAGELIFSIFSVLFISSQTFGLNFKTVTDQLEATYDVEFALLEVDRMEKEIRAFLNPEDYNIAFNR